MTTRVPCKECGAEILPSTAEVTGGICMACKQGIRKNIEASKKYYEEQRKYDPFRELWRSLVNCVHKTPEGYRGLSSDERTYFAVGVLDGEVYNGGMHQFFSNSSGEYYDDAVNGLLELKALKTVELLMRSKVLLFGDSDPPADHMLRNRQIRDYPEGPSAPEPEWVTELERIDDLYYEDPDGLGDRLDEFARTKGLVTPFEQPAEQGSAHQSTTR